MSMAGMKEGNYRWDIFPVNESSSVAPVGLIVCHVLHLSLVELFVAAVKVHCFTGATCLRHTHFGKSWERCAMLKCQETVRHQILCRTQHYVFTAHTLLVKCQDVLCRIVPGISPAACVLWKHFAVLCWKAAGAESFCACTYTIYASATLVVTSHMYIYIWCLYNVPSPSAWDIYFLSHATSQSCFRHLELSC